MSEKFDFNQALASLQSDQYLTGKDGILTPLCSRLMVLKFYLGCNRILFGTFIGFKRPAGLGWLRHVKLV